MTDRGDRAANSRQRRVRRAGSRRADSGASSTAHQDAGIGLNVRITERRGRRLLDAVVWTARLLASSFSIEVVLRAYDDYLEIFGSRRAPSSTTNIHSFYCSSSGVGDDLTF